MLDLNDPTLDERLRRRSSEGRYEISEVELVLNIRAFKAAGNTTAVRKLSEVLLYRNASLFQRYSLGLHHRPELREEAIANMGERLLREAQDPKEEFLTKNFIHALRCICADEFKRVLRQEGMSFRRDNEGNPSGRPQHVPRTLIETLSRPAAADDEGPSAADVADPQNQYEQLHADEECQRILTYLRDPLDCLIMVLRAIYDMKWDDIAKACQRNERTVRLRYERARNYLKDCLKKEQHITYTPVIRQQ